MQKPWIPDKAVTQDLAIALIESQFPELCPPRIVKIGEGWDNVAYLVNNKFIFRFPQREVAVGCIEREIKLLPYIARNIDLPIPVPIHVGKGGEEYDWPYYGYEKLVGETACKVGVGENERDHLAEPIANFLKGLHTLSSDKARELGAKEDPFERMNPKKRIPVIKERLEFIKPLGLVAEIPQCEKFLEIALKFKVPKRESVVHGDFYVRHMLLDKQQKLSGVIDWGDVHLGNPSVDLSICHSFLPASNHKIFRDAYGEIDDDTWQMARLGGLFWSVAILVYGHEVADVDLVREGKTGIEFIEEGLKF